MRIKTFQGRSLDELLPEIRAELGGGAVVIGQRQKVQGGVAGFFGTKVIEVTAADSMPSDDQLVQLEEQFMRGDAPDAAPAAAATAPVVAAAPAAVDEAALAERFAGAMSMGRRGGLDVTDEWDPSQDAELAQEYGRVLEHAASSGFAELELPVVAPTPQRDPMAEARALAERSHANMRAATSNIDSAAYGAAPAAPSAGATYAPPRPLPSTSTPESHTFSASVIDAPSDPFEPQAIEHGTAAANVDHALRADLALARSTEPMITEALNAAVDALDLKAMAALRSAVHATRRSHDSSRLDSTVRDIQADLDNEIQPLVARMMEVGVDRDVVESIIDVGVRHRLPFGERESITGHVRSMVEETLDVHSGFPQLARAYRMGFVGGANSGKTTVVTKVARGYASIGMRVGVISIIAAEPGVALRTSDQYRSIDTTVDVRYAATVDQALDAAAAMEDLDLVLVDTPAGTYLDPDVQGQVKSCLDAIGVDDIHLVLPLATSQREAGALAEAFRAFGVNRMAVSRIDETRYFGEILNLCFRLGLPMTFLSEGPAEGSDLRVAIAREVAERILPASDLRS
ncbi:MAG: hypothetical protein JWM86_470 [Thermoleophilia bacterium]|nr:hypothetical protein [Thermoleophilia bacterium]